MLALSPLCSPPNFPPNRLVPGEAVAAESSAHGACLYPLGVSCSGVSAEHPYPAPRCPRTSSGRCGRWSRPRGRRRSGPPPRWSRSRSHSPRSATRPCQHRPRAHPGIRWNWLQQPNVGNNHSYEDQPQQRDGRKKRNIDWKVESWSVFAGWVAHPGGLQCGFLTLVFACSPLSCSYSSEKPEGHLVTFPCPALQPRVPRARRHVLRAVPSWASLLILGLANPVSKHFPKTFPAFCWSSPHLGPRQLPNCSIKWRLHLTPHNKNCSQFPKGPAGPRATEKPLV